MAERKYRKNTGRKRSNKKQTNKKKNIKKKQSSLKKDIGCRLKGSFSLKRIAMIAVMVLFGGCYLQFGAEAKSIEVPDIWNLSDDLFKEANDVLDDIQLLVTKVNRLLSNQEEQSGISLSDIPEYNDEPYVELHQNVPSFTKDEITTKAYEYYSELDSLGRCGVTMACIGTELMPTEERGAIGMIRPSGWKLKKYDIVEGKYVYNRCHLIGFQLTGENANEKNLITGTRYLNVTGMLPFENETAEYIRKTGNHVMYRVTPIFDGDNLVASGVEMEAWSVEDEGQGISFHVYVYNVQPGIEIDYATGDNWLAR